MPIYEYKCQKCGDATEKLRNISDPELTLCTACGTNNLKRIMSATSFRLSGSGWYESDFKTANKRNLADSKQGKPAASDVAKPKSPTTENK